MILYYHHSHESSAIRVQVLCQMYFDIKIEPHEKQLFQLKLRKDELPDKKYHIVRLLMVGFIALSEQANGRKIHIDELTRMFQSN